MDKVFIDGMMFKAPHENAPDFVKGKVSFKLKEFFEFAKIHQKDGWLNADMKVSKGGKTYFELDTYEAKAKEPEKPDFDDDLGF